MWCLRPALGFPLVVDCGTATQLGSSCSAQLDAVAGIPEERWRTVQELAEVMAEAGYQYH